MALRRQAEFLQGLEIELEDDRVGPADETEGGRPFEIVAIGVAIIFHVVGQFVEPVAAILDIALELLRIGLAPAMEDAFLAAPAGERTDAGAALMIDHVIGIAAGIARRQLGN